MQAGWQKLREWRSLKSSGIILNMRNNSQLLAPSGALIAIPTYY